MQYPHLPSQFFDVPGLQGLQVCVCVCLYIVCVCVCVNVHVCLNLWVYLDAYSLLNL